MVILCTISKSYNSNVVAKQDLTISNHGKVEKSTFSPLPIRLWRPMQFEDKYPPPSPATTSHTPDSMSNDLELQHLKNESMCHYLGVSSGNQHSPNYSPALIFCSAMSFNCRAYMGTCKFCRCIQHHCIVCPACLYNIEQGFIQDFFGVGGK